MKTKVHRSFAFFFSLGPIYDDEVDDLNKPPRMSLTQTYRRNSDGRQQPINNVNRRIPINNGIYKVCSFILVFIRIFVFMSMFRMRIIILKEQQQTIQQQRSIPEIHLLQRLMMPN